MSSSNIAAMRGRNSTTVTFVPSRAQTEPSSSPIAPPPITIIDSGAWPSAIAWSLLSTVSPSNSRNGRPLTELPVAIRMRLVFSVRAASPPVTSTSPALTMRPEPLTCSMPFLFIR